MTCVDFGDTNCLCRPIRVTSDSDDAFGNCMISGCDAAESEGLSAHGLPRSVFAPILSGRMEFNGACRA